MATPGQIRIVADFMEHMAQQMDQVRQKVDLLAEPGVAANLHDAPESYNAYLDIGGKWDNKRGELRESLQVASDALTEVLTAFRDADEKLAKELVEAGD